MSSERIYQPITISKKTFYTDEGEPVSGISISLDDDEIVPLAPTLEDAIKQFDYFVGG